MNSLCGLLTDLYFSNTTCLSFKAWVTNQHTEKKHIRDLMAIVLIIYENLAAEQYDAFLKKSLIIFIEYQMYLAIDVSWLYMKTKIKQRFIHMESLRLYIHCNNRLSVCMNIYYTESWKKDIWNLWKTYLYISETIK